MVSLRRLGLFLTLLGLVLILISQIMPTLKQHLSVTWTGPTVEFTRERLYWIDRYLTPPIEGGGWMRVTLNSSKPGSTSLLIFPSTPDGDSLGPSLVSKVFDPQTERFDMATTATHSGYYMVMVTSWNSTYTLTLSSTWSPFNEIRMLLLPGVILLGGGLLAYYYGGVKATLRRMYGLESEQTRR